MHGAMERDASLLEQLPHIVTWARPEDGQRAFLGGHEGELDVVGRHFVRTPGGHQRELVQRQGPRDARRDNERDPPRVLPLQVLDEAVELLAVLLATEGRRVLVWLFALRAGGDHELVVAKLLAAGRPDEMRAGRDRGEPVLNELDPQIARELLQRDALRVPERKGLAHRERLEDEVLLRRE